MAEFKDWLSSYTDPETCLEAFGSQKRFFRVNTLKIGLERFREVSGIKREKIKECPAAFVLKEERSFEIGKTWEYFLGYIYPQSLPSMLVSLVIGPGRRHSVLDAAAAPGSKFSHMAMLMENQGVLVGNDLKGDKISALYATINRMNILNCIVTVRDGAKLEWKERFDRIVVDAPCTALGSGENAMKRWKPEHSEKIARLQKKMLFSAYDALKPGGTIVYSTCTYAKEENEEVVANLLENVQTAKLENIELDIPHEAGLSEYGKEFGKCYRIYPQHLRSEGFFIAKITKVD